MPALLPRRAVWLIATLAVLGRYPGAIWPMRPDEAGFLLVARGWDPQPDSLFGTYWVDRAPPIIALTRLSDVVGGPLFLRAVAAVGVGVVVVLMADIGRRLAREAGSDEARSERVAVWTAAVTAALCIVPVFDSISAKGEILGIPLVAGAVLASLVALERRSMWMAFLAGLLAMLGPGMKQSMLGGLVFGGVLLVGALIARRLSPTAFARLAGGAILGAAIPVIGSVVWALVAGVRLDTLWYTVVGFRADASAVLASQPSDAPMERARELVDMALESGMLVALVWLVVSLPWVMRRLPVAGVAGVAMVGVDVAGVALGGSYWAPYLIAVIPSAAMAVALSLAVARPGHWWLPLGLVPRIAVVMAIVFAVTELEHWTGRAVTDDVPGEYRTGEAIGRSSEPGDTLVVYGGRADLQYASGLPSPYQHLWSLPMRTLDPDLEELGAMLRGPDPPTWVVTWVPLGSWGLPAEEQVLGALSERYILLAPTACGGQGIWRLAGELRGGIELRCDEPYRRVFGRPF